MSRYGKRWVFVDLDCTLIDTKDLVISGGPEPTPGTPEHDAWVNYVTNPAIVAKAPPVISVLSLVRRLEKTGQVFYLTNRRRKMWDITREWLLSHRLGGTLLMRPDDETSRAGEFKEKMIKVLAAQHSDTVLMIDDDPDGSVEEACRRNKWTFLKMVTY